MANYGKSVKVVSQQAPSPSNVVDKEKEKRRPNRLLNKNIGAVLGGVFSSADGICGHARERLVNGGHSGFNSPSSMHVSHDARSSSLTTSSKKCFREHLSEQEAVAVIKEGRAFRASFRVNVHNQLEAYCTVDGLPVDVLISGIDSQNRAIEGDVVVIMLDPVVLWAKLKGSPLSGSHTSVDNSEIVCEAREGFRGTRKKPFDEDYVLPISVRGASCSSVIVKSGMENGSRTCIGHNSSALDEPNDDHAFQSDEAPETLRRICSMIRSHPTKRPTGKVLAILKESPRRGAVVGFLSVDQWLSCRNFCRKQMNTKKSHENYSSMTSMLDCVYLLPTDPKFPKMVVEFGSFPDLIKERLHNGDNTVAKELVAARVEDWGVDSPSPRARVMHVLGGSGETEAQIAAILLENGIVPANFSPDVLACLPDLSWKVPTEEIKTRRDLRNVCIFTIDPSSAIDLDDALSVEVLSDTIFRVGVHIADVSFFVDPGSALDTEAHIRSSSIYVLQHKIPMLPPRLTQDVCSLVPGTDKLALSVMWDIDLSGNIMSRWIGRSVVRSCCKLSYDIVQDIIDGSLDVLLLDSPSTSLPPLLGKFDWVDIINSLRNLQEISLKLKEVRFKDGALELDNPKLDLLFDEDGTPCNCFLQGTKASHSIVEEYMLLANRSVAEVISSAFPDCALLRRHPEPNLRKLKEFEAFCGKQGFDLETSSSHQLHLSLSKIREKLSDDPVLFDILLSYAAKSMKLATYFCSGTLSDVEHDWVHYALSFPVYTHFTSPLRRYPDIIVHRMLLAIIDAEETYQKQISFPAESICDVSGNEIFRRCFTGLNFDNDIANSKEGRNSLKSAAERFNIPKRKEVALIAMHCNERKVASKLAEESSKMVYLWSFLNKKEFFISEARVLGLGPRFMSVYIHSLCMERRIYYDDVEGLAVDWFETTCTIVLDLIGTRRSSRRGSSGKLRSLDDVAVMIDPSDIFVLEGDEYHISMDKDPLLKATHSEDSRLEPVVFPLTLRLLSSFPVALHAAGGDGSPVSIGVRLCMSSYFSGSVRTEN